MGLTRGYTEARVRMQRRAPLPVLRRLRLMLQWRCVECNELLRVFGIEIARREGEPLAIGLDAPEHV
jgi:hypothetical protein